MTKRTRKIILLLAILFFILITPTTLFYAWGYSFDWQTKKPVLTGGIYLKSIPKRAQVYLNDKPQEQTTPIFIKRLLPKEYQIRVTKQGYHSWQKTLRVESKIVTEAKNILLIPLSPKIETVNPELALEFSEEPTSIFYIHQPSYILYRTDKDNSFQEQINLTPLPSNHDYQIFTSNNDQLALLDEQNQLYLLNPQTKNFEIISQDVQGLEFSHDNNKLLYYTSSEIWIYHLPLSEEINNNKELVTRISQKIKQAIWYKTNQHIIFSIEEKIKIVELDNRSDRNIIDLIKIKLDKMVYSQKHEKLYLIKGDELLTLSLE